ncbi:hypothetical protein FQA39_LY06644 [Lamprigera yunnana]|nr:hypothetical protein FQA39_LY06644 [Lamprigera yunnana]
MKVTGTYCLLPQVELTLQVKFNVECSLLNAELILYLIVKYFCGYNSKYFHIIDLLISDPSGSVNKAQNDKKLDTHIKITAAEPHELSSFKAAVTKAPCQEDLLPTDNVTQNDTKIEEISGYSDDSIDDPNHQPESLDDNISKGNEHSEDDKPENIIIALLVNYTDYEVLSSPK